jgi:UDP-N-acetylmuramoyl-tripeptide--D-alanyl-D-alanine ligase
MATPIPDNRAAFSLVEAAHATGATLSGDATEVRGVTTDSRGDLAGKLFVALEGERFDGHDFVGAAVRAGAAAVLVNRDADAGTATQLRVASTLDALGALARLHRRRWGGTLVAIGGSAGKTTTRSAVSAVLSALHPGAVHFSHGNLNNRVGVPMVLFGLEPEHRFAVIEVGTNAPGEVRELGAISEPDVAVLTLIAVEHAEGLGDLDAIEAEEGALFRDAATAVGNADDARVSRQLDDSSALKKIRYGASAGADYRLLGREPRALGGTRVHVERPGTRGREAVSLETSLVGLPGALAALAAFAIAEHVAGASVDPTRVSAALGRAGEPGRLSVLQLGDGTLLLDDTYNANPASMKSSIAVARELATERGARLVLVLGEMRELGASSKQEHAALARAVAESGASALVAVAGDAALLVDPARAARIDATFAPDVAGAIEPALARVRPGDVVLVKASRGVEAERVVARLVSAKGRAA